ncbi:MAG: glycosyltransferase family 2 protein [Chitinophagaceae bacterium]
MVKISIVISCRNEAPVISKTLESLVGVSDDIVVYDNGSTDGTQLVVKQFPVNLQEGSFDGFGPTKNKANAFTRYDWILSLDADEAIDEELKQSLLAFDPGTEKVVYDLSFKSFFGNAILKYGEWGGDHHIRLFNKKHVSWDAEPVHEQLLVPAGFAIKKMKGYVLHRTMADINDYVTKMTGYAMLNAEKYFRQGKKASWFKLRCSPGFTFFNYYILKLGFLDGHAGYVCAKMTAYYTFLKYARLKELANNEQRNKEQGMPK